MKAKLKEFWIKYEYKIILAVGFLLVAAISFEFGYIQGKTLKTSPIVVEKPSESLKIGSEGPVSGTMGSNSTATQKVPVEATSQIPQNCAYVGSKNSNKYHISTCHFAKLIKPENLACFKSAEDAIAQGKVGDKGCIK